MQPDRTVLMSTTLICLIYYNFYKSMLMYFIIILYFYSTIYYYNLKFKEINFKSICPSLVFSLCTALIVTGSAYTNPACLSL